MHGIAAPKKVQLIGHEAAEVGGRLVRAGGRAAMDCHGCGHQATGSESSDGDRAAHD